MHPWAEVDELIIRHRSIEAIKIVWEQLGVPLREAIEQVQERYDWLQETRPQDLAGRLSEESAS